MYARKRNVNLSIFENMKLCERSLFMSLLTQSTVRIPWDGCTHAYVPLSKLFIISDFNFYRVKICVMIVKKR